MRVLFWWVPRRCNQEANTLANRAYRNHVVHPDLENYLEYFHYGDVEQKYYHALDMVAERPESFDSRGVVRPG